MLNRIKNFSINKIPIAFWILLIALAIIWGSSFYAVSISLRNFGPLQIAAGRILFGAILLTILCYVYGDGFSSFVQGPRRVWFYSFGMGFFTNALPFSLLSWAQTDLLSSFAGIAMSFVPFMTLILAHFFVRAERLSIQKILGLLIGAIGMFILFDFYDLYQQWNETGNFKFKLACFGAAACYSIGAIITRRAPFVLMLPFSASGLLAACVVILPTVIIVEGLPIVYDLKAFLALVYLGLIPTGLATAILVYIVKGVGPTFLSLVNYMVPVWALGFGVIFNSEQLKSSWFFALIFIFFGMLLIQSRIKKI